MYAAILWFCAAVSAGVFAVMIYSVATFRHRQRIEAPLARKTVEEIAWALVPIAIMLSAAVPTIRALASGSP